MISLLTPAGIIGFMIFIGLLAMLLNWLEETKAGQIVQVLFYLGLAGYIIWTLA